MEISTTDERTLLTTLTNSCWRTAPGVPAVALGVINAGVGDDGDAVAERPLEQLASVRAAITPAATTPEAGANFRALLIRSATSSLLLSPRFAIITPAARAAIAGSATFRRR